MEKLYIGLDLGANGGVVVLKEDGTVLDVFKTPQTTREWQDKLNKYSDKHCFCITEKVHSQPHNGSKAAFSYGLTVGKTLTMLDVCKIPFQEVAPQTWMKTYSMKKNTGETGTKWKGRLKDRAQQIFPKEKVVLWNADAYLIAEYCRRNFK